MTRIIFGLLALVAVAYAQEQCTICQALIGAVESELENQSTEAEIAHLIEKLCKEVPAFNSTCVAIVEQGVPTVINWIENNENATVVCNQLSLCKSRESFDMKLRKQFGHGGFRASVDCQACQAGVKFVESWLAENSTIVAIENKFESTVCKFIPNIEATCDAVTEAGIPRLINYIEQNENATVVCQQLKVCSAEAMRAAKMHDFLMARKGFAGRLNKARRAH